MKNMISWFEIPANDISRAKAFYEKLFDVTMTEMDLGDGATMAIFPGDENSISGAVIKYEGFYTPSHDGPLIYLNCDDDLQPFQDQVESLGGKVLMPKKQISEEHGYMAIIEDCEGNRVALYSLG
jgi:hypothetical protein